MARARRPDDEDDDDFDDRPRRPRGRRADDDRGRPPPPSNAPKILLIIGGVFVALTLICGGVALYIYNSIAKGINQVQQDMHQKVQQNLDEMREEEKNADKPKATAAVSAFFQEVRGDRLAAAYQMTSSDYRKRVPETEFGELVAANAKNLKSGHLNVVPDVFAPNKGTTYAYEIWVGFATANVTAVNENGKWVIDRFTIANR